MARRRHLTPACESLDSRLVLSTIAGPIAAPLPPPVADPSLTATLVIGKGLSRHDYVEVDGSDYDDHITVTSFRADRTSVTLTLEKWMGTTRLSSQAVTLNSPAFHVIDYVDIYGGNGNNQIVNQTSLSMSAHGGAGNDLIEVGTTGSYVDGGGGDDTIIGGAGNDYLVGGAGNDYIRGGAGDDYIAGEEGSDLLYGDDGNDTIYGDNTFVLDTGNVIQGGNGDDKLFGGDGDDTIDGDAGNDIIYGMLGNDTLRGDDGNDIIFGDFGSTDDQTSDQDGNDWISGGAGDDQIWGDGGNDILWGDSGNDRLYGDNGVDQLYGGDGNDYLDGGHNDPNFYVDYLVGGAGADTFVRHESLFGVDDGDVFADYNTAQGDSTNTVHHW
jgi:Ca2+-binding RTX toxin-like protein